MKREEVFEHLVVVKRSGQRVSFNEAKIAVAIKMAFDNSMEETNEKEINKVFNAVLNYISSLYQNRKTINVEDIQDIIENILKEMKYVDVYKSFNEYRLRRAASREAFSVKEQHKFVKAIEKIGFTVRNSEDNKPLDLMLNFGKTISQEFAEAYLIESKYLRAHKEGRIRIDAIETYPLAISSSGHLDLTNITCDNLNKFTYRILQVIREFKEEQYKEQTINNIDKLYGSVILNEFKNDLLNNLKNTLGIVGIWEYLDQEYIENSINELNTMDINNKYFGTLIVNSQIGKYFEEVLKITKNDIRNKIIDNINTLFIGISKLNSRLSCNMVSLSVNDEGTYEENLFNEIYFDKLNKDINNLVTIYKYKRNIEDYVLDAIASKNKILILFVDNVKFDGDIECFSDGIIINENINNEIQTSNGKVLLSTTTINLARLGLKYNEEKIDMFYQELDELMEFCKNQMILRFEIMAGKYKENYNYIFNDNILFDSKRLEEGQRVRKILKHGSLNMAFVGLSECIRALTNKEDIDYDLGLKIINFMKERINKYTVENKLNFILSENGECDKTKYLHALDKSMYGNLDVLKNNKYSKLTDSLNKLSNDKIFNIVSVYQAACNCDFGVNLASNTPRNKIKEVIEKAGKAKIKTMKVMVGKNEY